MSPRHESSTIVVEIRVHDNAEFCRGTVPPIDDSIGSPRGDNPSSPPSREDRFGGPSPDARDSVRASGEAQDGTRGARSHSDGEAAKAERVRADFLLRNRMVFYCATRCPTSAVPSGGFCLATTRYVTLSYFTNYLTRGH